MGPTCGRCHYSYCLQTLRLLQRNVPTASQSSAFFSAQVLNALVTAILPGLALKIFVKLLPGLLALLNRHSGGQMGQGGQQCERACLHC